VDVRPAEAVEVVTRFTDYPGRYLLHCHNLEHEDMAMMADFTVG
jgi:FtsP/CotA-like multicopper oxidase with cupredoxin domain